MLSSLSPSPLKLAVYIFLKPEKLKYIQVLILPPTLANNNQHVCSVLVKAAFQLIIRSALTLLQRVQLVKSKRMKILSDSLTPSQLYSFLSLHSCFFEIKQPKLAGIFFRVLIVMQNYSCFTIINLFDEVQLPLNDVKYPFSEGFETTTTPLISLSPNNLTSELSSDM